MIIVGTEKPLKIGVREGFWHVLLERNVPVLVLREASLEEYLAQEETTEEARRIVTAPNTTFRYFYAVHTD